MLDFLMSLGIWGWCLIGIFFLFLVSSISLKRKSPKGRYDDANKKDQAKVAPYTPLS